MQKILFFLIGSIYPINCYSDCQYLDDNSAVKINCNNLVITDSTNPQKYECISTNKKVLPVVLTKINHTVTIDDKTYLFASEQSPFNNDFKTTINISLVDKDNLYYNGYLTLESESLLSRTLELEIFLVPEYQGKGLGTKFVQAIYNYISQLVLKESLEFDGLVLLVAPQNIASVRMNEKLGGQICSAFSFPKFLNPEPHYLYIYQITKLQQN